MNNYDLLVNYLEEQHNEVFHQWANIKEQLDILEREKELQREKDKLERMKPQLLELANWCKENKEWLDSLNTTSEKMNAIQLSLTLMIDSLDAGDLSRVGTYKTAIRSIASDIPELYTVGYLKNGHRVITPFNSCWEHKHRTDVPFDSNAEYDWREEE